MSGKSHPFVDRFNRTLRMKSKEPHPAESRRDPIQPNPSGDGGVEDPESHRVVGDNDQSAGRAEERSYDRAQSRNPLALGRIPASGLPPRNDAYTTPRRPLPDDGMSVSSDLKANLKDLTLQGMSAASNKRAAADLAPGQDLETGGRPSKRAGSLDDPVSRGPASHLDAARDQRPRDFAPAALPFPVSPELPDTQLHRVSSKSPTMPQKGSAGLIPADKVPQLFSTGQHDFNPAADRFTSTSPPTSPTDDTSHHHGFAMLLQPETRPITQDQLVNEVKGIYAGLVMVEKKCVEIDQQQSSTTNRLTNEQWQALIALHRTLLHEHHDFFLASQHPSSSPALRRLAAKYAMPARMWRHGIHSFLELLRHRLPDSLDHMLAFVYLAYSMMALLMESVPSFEETWIECLGDLARYRMAIEEADLRDREVWSGVARMWYNKAADKSPDVGRIQHHLAVLSRPNIVQQLFYYSKALVSVVPFQNARESIMLLFNPFLEGSEIASQRYPLVESALVKAHGIQFTRGSILEYTSLMDQFCSVLDNHIGRVTAKFRVQGPEMASSLCAATFDFGNPNSVLFKAFHEIAAQKKARLEAWQSTHGQEEPPPEDPKVRHDAMETYWLSFYDTSSLARADPHSVTDLTTKDATFSGSHDSTAYACQSLGQTTTVVSQRIGDKNILPYMHVILAYLFGLAFVPNALIYVEGLIPWENITMFLNTLGRSGVVDARFEGVDFPQQMSGTGRQLPEDFVMRGLLWAQFYLPTDFFTGQVVDEDERNLELPSHAAPRAERCLWLGLNRWIRYDSHTKQFSVTDLARSLERVQKDTLASRSQTLSAQRDLVDADMIDVEH